MNSVIQIKDLVVEYKNKRALDGITLEVSKGEAFGFLGPNGAGKSTAIKTILGLVFPKEGSVLIAGKPPTDIHMKQDLGFLPEEAMYYRFLNPTEILSFYGSLFKIPKKELKNRIQALLELVHLDHVSKKPLQTFSKGMVQRVGLAQALINDPQVLILDEPMSGLDPMGRMELREILEDLKSKGKTIFLSSHELSEVELICDSIAIVYQGKIIRSGGIKDILSETKEKSLERYFLDTIKGQVS